jgi:hypothetical protein
LNSNQEAENTGDHSKNKSTDTTSQPEFNRSTDITSNKDNGNEKEQDIQKINQWKEYGKKWIDPLTIVTIVLAIATYLLYRQASEDSKIAQQSAISAKRSANAAENTFKEQKYVDSIRRRSDSIKNRVDSLINANRFNLDSINMSAQINSFKQTQSDFEIENRPFLVSSNIILDTSFTNNIISIKYEIINVGKFPAKVSYMAAKINYGIDTSHLFINEDKWAVRPSKEYLPNSGKVSGVVTIQSNPDYIRLFRRNNIHIYLYFNLQYHSSVLKTNYHNYIVWRITLTGKNVDASAIENK